MRTLTFVCATFVLLRSVSAEPPSPAPEPLVIDHVTVIDGNGGPAATDMTVVIAAGRIAAVEKSGSAAKPAGARLIDGRGRFLIPGLWDMHVHEAEKFLPVLLANGITGIRDLAGGIPARKDVATGRVAGPRVFAAGGILDGPNPVIGGSFAIDTPEEARQVVRFLRYRGADFIKVFHFLSRESYFAVADEAAIQRIPFAGHVSFEVSAAEASDAGQRSMEHLEAVILGSSSRESEIRAEVARSSLEFEGSQADRHRLWIVRWLRAEEEALASYDPKRAAALMARLAANRTWQVPTLTLRLSIAHRADPAFIAAAQSQYAPQYIRTGWVRGVKDIDAAQLRDAGGVLERSLQLVHDLREAGVPILAGTDAPNPYLVPGFSLHQELGLLVRAGLSPAEALQAATREPARFLGILDEVGTVEPKKAADLVLLDANPLEEIGHTRNIAAVIRGGRFYDRDALQALLEEAQSALSIAAGPPTQPPAPAARLRPRAGS